MVIACAKESLRRVISESTLRFTHRCHCRSRLIFKDLMDTLRFQECSQAWVDTHNSLKDSNSSLKVMHPPSKVDSQAVEYQVPLTAVVDSQQTTAHRSFHQLEAATSMTSKQGLTL